MLIGIVGFGKIGSIYAHLCRQQGYHVVTIDPYVCDSSFVSVRVLPSEVTNAIQVWLICTPTDTHVQVLDQILQLRPNARVLVEKPACPLEHMARLEALLHQFPEARIALSDTYGHSPIVSEFVSFIQNEIGGDRVSRITVELSKNRGRDEVNGRFIDGEYGDAGYEGFHLLSIEERLRNGLNSNLDRRMAAALYTSVRGEILSDFGFRHAYLSKAVREIVAAGRIPFGSEFRYRFAQVVSESGRRWTLVFEPLFGMPGFDSKNTHVMISAESQRQQRWHWIQANQLEKALLAQIRLLLAGSGRITKEMIDRHHRIATITTAMNKPEKVVSL